MKVEGAMQQNPCGADEHDCHKRKKDHGRRGCPDNHSHPNRCKKRKRQTQFTQIMGRLMKNKVAMSGLIVLIIIILASVFAPWVAPYDPNYMDYSSLNAGSSFQHLLGCDNLGRDLLSRIIYGGRNSLALGLVCALIGMVSGVFFGCIVGYCGGQVDNLVMRICDIWMAIPGTLLAIIISASFGSGFWYTVLALTVGAIPGSIRGTRSMALKEREMEYLEAAKAMNCSRLKIIFRHMMPNIIASHHRGHHRPDRRHHDDAGGTFLHWAGHPAAHRRMGRHVLGGAGLHYEISSHDDLAGRGNPDHGAGHQYVR